LRLCNVKAVYDASSDRYMSEQENKARLEIIVEIVVIDSEIILTPSCNDKRDLAFYPLYPGRCGTKIFRRRT
jgi:hypothetical protein